MATQLKKTVKPSGGDYTSLEACMNANEQNLVTADQYFDVEIDGSWASADTTAVTIHNYTTDATHYINIYTTGDARHNGKAAAVSGLSSYRLITTTHSISVLSANIIIDGLEIQCTGTSWCTRHGVYGNVAGNIKVINNIITNVGTTANADGFGIFSNEYEKWTIYNNIIYNIISKGISVGNLYGGSVTIYNNTIYNYNTVASTNKGITIIGAYTVKNNLVIAGAGGGDCYGFSGGTSATNGGSDTTGDIDNMTAADLFVSVTAGSEDLHLKAGADAIDVGTDLSAIFTTDIDGTTRPTGANTWDIGADEYVSAVTPDSMNLVDRVTVLKQGSANL